MVLKLKGKKKGMTQRFLDNGHVVACTVIEVEPNVITQVKTEDSDGYTAIQLACDKVTTKDPRTAERRSTKAQRGHYAKASVEPHRQLMEARLESVEEYEVGQEIKVDAFTAGDLVDVSATSKGKGFQGVQKRYNFSGGPATHGSGFHRAPGSIGMRSTPGRVFQGKPMPGCMGNEKVTVEHLEVLCVDVEQNRLVVKGSIPGANGSWVSIRKSIKKQGN